jgi:hypothetical protein
VVDAALQPAPAVPATRNGRPSYVRVRGSVGLGSPHGSPAPASVAQAVLAASAALAGRAQANLPAIAEPEQARLRSPLPAHDFAGGEPPAWPTPELGAVAAGPAVGRLAEAALDWEDVPRLDAAADRLGELADALAALLDDEADLRGIAR